MRLLLLGGYRFLGRAVVDAALARGHTVTGDLIAACIEATAAGAEPVWVDDAFLRAEGVEEDRELPYWTSDGENGIFDVAIGRALATGLVTRPLAETARRTYAWHRARADRTTRKGLAPARERALLARFAAAQTPFSAPT